MARWQRGASTPHSPAALRAFTLVELLVATTILLILLVALVQATGVVGQIWSSNRGKVSSSENARAGFTLITETLTRATLNTYNDYVDASGNPRDPNNPTAFVPARFARTSELHFISGPTSLLLSGADAASNPGHAVFFQSPLGETTATDLTKLGHTLDSVGFYLQYGAGDYGTVLPAWLKSAFAKPLRYRLMEVVQPTETFSLYTLTTGAGYTGKYTDMIKWLKAFQLPPAATQPRPRIVAEDVLLLIVLPKLDPANEKTLAGKLGVAYVTDSASAQYNAGSILCPNYNYDSRAWQTNYAGAARGTAGMVPTMGTSPNDLISAMRNQLPPVVEVAMVCADRLSLNKLDLTTAAPPAALRAPATSFINSAKLSADLAAYTQQLTTAHVKFHVFRASVEMHAARWSFN